jgi:predicted transcriptional regulator
MKASHKQHSLFVGNQLIVLSPGQFVFGRKMAAEETGMGQQEIRTCIKILEKMKNLTIKPTNKFSIITIINWDTYQDVEEKTTSKLTNNQPTDNQQITTNNNVKNDKKKDIVDSDESTGEEVYYTYKKRRLSGKRLESFKRFWEAFNYKDGKAKAADSWFDIPKLTESFVDQIVSAAKAEAQRRPGLISKGKTPKMAQGWITERRWEDETYKNPPESSYPIQEVTTIEEIEELTRKRG